jgi:hypothetical protein
MIRYNTKHFWRMKPATQGDWVRYSEVEERFLDLEEELDSNKAEIAALIAEVDFQKERKEVYYDTAKDISFKSNFYKLKLELIGHIAFLAWIFISTVLLACYGLQLLTL